MNGTRHVTAAAILIAAALVLPAAAESEPDEVPPIRNPVREFLEQHEVEYHGFYEGRIGTRVVQDPYEDDLTMAEARYQLDLFTTHDWGDLKFTGDVLGDFAEMDLDFDLREANYFTRPTDFLDLKIGRQILTWGTGDLIFINDLFPKDYVSFFIGRNVEYLKVPSDSIKVSLFSDWANLDVVYTPEFDPDRYITGERLSYWNPLLGRRAGEDDVLSVDKRRDWFEEDETAVRLYRTIHNYELALYGYWGYWKSPAGYNSSLTQAIFPGLYVYGASVRGAVGKGIGNVEIGYYDSVDDPHGNNPLIDNSQMRYLVGYTQEVAPNFTAGVQYYVEQMIDYRGYRTHLFPGTAPRDEFRHVITLRLTQLLMNQNLMLSFFAFYSPSDNDAYLRPSVSYKASDNLSIEVGSNVFFGDEPYTFFNQFHNDTNIYTGVRYSF